MPLTINSNIPSVNAQRRFGASSRELGEAFTRLSSGLRINRAMDDAAGLAISTALSLDARVFHQGIRNINDGVSFLNIAEGAATELRNVVIRQRELATQAANGTLSRSQRKSLHEEASALVDEFNRIVDTTTFNGRPIFVAGQAPMRLQASYGENGGVEFALADGLSRTVGNGDFTQGGDYVTLGNYEIRAADLNGDGHQDLVSADFGVNALVINLGNGDATFRAPVSFAATANIARLEVGDLNGDSALDVAAVAYGSTSMFVFLGNGNGSFKAVKSTLLDGRGSWINMEDFNGDNTLDIVTTSRDTSKASIMLNDGNGNFSRVQSLPTVDIPFDIAIEDFNNDSVFDLAFSIDNGFVGIALGNVDGTFRASQNSIVGGASEHYAIVAGDLNGDGQMDVISSEYATNQIKIQLGNGNGTLRAATIVSIAPSPSSGMELLDMNGDGRLDLLAVSEGSSKTSLFLGNGDGSFRAATSFNSAAAAFCLAVADFNEDGARDFVTGAGGAGNYARVQIAKTQESVVCEDLDLRTGASAKESMSVIDGTLRRLSSELGAIGAMQSRLSTAVNNLGTSGESYLEAASRIVDADTATESAQLVKTRILQQAGAAVLAQANQQPTLALVLLNS